jgi:hypothetical protein
MLTSPSPDLPKQPDKAQSQTAKQLKIQPILESIGVVGATLQTASFQRMVRPLASNQDNIETSQYGVEGKSFDTHDFYHGIAREVFLEIQTKKPELLDRLQGFDFDFDNFAPFNLKGERAARNIQNIIGSVTLVQYKGKEYISINKQVFFPGPLDTREVAGIATELIDSIRHSNNYLTHKDLTQLTELLTNTETLKGLIISDPTRFFEYLNSYISDVYTD